MIKVIIAEDEKIFRDYLASLIPWHEYGFELVGLARNGVEALELCDESDPDIALLDIGMPLIDGISLAAQIREKNPSLYISFITGHSEFDYAQKAIKVQAEDYIIKPVDKNELLKSLLRTKTKILQKRENLKVLNKTLSLSIETMFIKLLEKDLSCDLNLLDSYLLSNNKYSETFIVTTLEVDDLYAQLQEKIDIRSLKNRIKQTVSRLLPSPVSVFVLNGDENCIVSILGLNKSRIENNYIDTLLKNIINAIYSELNVSISIGVGNPYDSLNQITTSYTESKKVLVNKSATQYRQLLYYTLVDSPMLYSYNTLYYEELIMLLRSNNSIRLMAELNNIYDQLNDSKASLNQVYFVSISLISICLSYITEMNIEISSVLGNDFLLTYVVSPKLMLASSKKIIFDIFEKTLICFDYGKRTKAKRTSEQIKAYIKVSYCNSDLNLKSISSHFYLHPDYVRKVFKNEQRQSIKEYITQLRMQKAKELLDQGDDMKISSICHAVGYNDISYFSKSFKKYFGVNPSAL